MEPAHPEPTVRQVAEDLILVEVAGRRILAEAACPHRKGRMRFGYVNERTLRITCPLHHSTFDLLSGAQLSGPSCRPLQVAVLDDFLDAKAADAIRDVEGVVRRDG